MCHSGMEELLQELVTEGLASDVPSSIDPDIVQSDSEEELLDFCGSDIEDLNYEPDNDDVDDSNEESSSENEDNFLSGSRTSGLAITELSSSVGRDGSGHLDGSRGSDGSRVPSSRSQRDRDI
ncbi:hypothetical protein J6590_033280 [Homalodisca vitripennis]|nr:hypothetical protein J6590_033280 [Homalodisca vitripennis]